MRLCISTLKVSVGLLKKGHHTFVFDFVSRNQEFHDTAVVAVDGLLPRTLNPYRYSAL